MAEDTEKRKDEVIPLPDKTDKADIDKQANAAMLELMKSKKAELDETLAQVEKRNKEFKELVEEMKLSGRAAGGAAEISEEEKSKKAALKLIEGTGFEKRIIL